VGAIDDTHVLARVPAKHIPAFMGRKHTTMQSTDKLNIYTRISPLVVGIGEELKQLRGKSSDYSRV
jgi:hypothetical protein